MEPTGPALGERRAELPRFCNELRASLHRVSGGSPVAPGTVPGERARRGRAHRRTGASGAPVIAQVPEVLLVRGGCGWEVVQAAPSEAVSDVVCSDLL
ncbi:hypothetical protein CUT44_13325 [Streptomyces carminius]|uniref:Uncharacterized protein n=1 Tax=Streptomyces carminius TaxID=2665496 RepID=A0A2M8LZ78_9ACTN|nr:hypothetical protein CUT44_13325 [Streptomyces carminius]